MKKLFLLLFAIMFIVPAIPQNLRIATGDKGSIREPDIPVPAEAVSAGRNFINPTVMNKYTVSDPSLVTTYYDLQTHASSPNRFCMFSDGTFGAAVIMSHDDTSSNNPDRGTGYNYFDGSGWGAPPSSRIETVRTGWPSIAPFGTDGEIVLAYQGPTLPLVYNTRSTKGTGNWVQAEIPLPPGATGMLYPRMVTNGSDHMNIHVLGVTTPVGSGGLKYEGLDGALLYNRSTDGGATWDGWQILPGMDSTLYLGFSSDNYAWAEPQDELLCFVAGSRWSDEFIMKSTDNGLTWTKTVIWSCPWNLWTGGDSTGVFYCSDGASAVAMDYYGTAHVAFGLMRSSGDAGGAKYWYPWTDGIIFWNENMPELPQSLDPAVLTANGNYVGWVQDTNVWNAQPEELRYFYLSMSSMPGIIIQDFNVIYLFWSSVTNMRDGYNCMLRHVFARASDDSGETWQNVIHDMTGDFTYSWRECTYPVVLPEVHDGALHFLFQEDSVAGVSLLYPAGITIITQNSIDYGWVHTDYFWENIRENEIEAVNVSQNYPNPAHEFTRFELILVWKKEIVISVSDLPGQTIYSIDMGKMGPGKFSIPIDISGLNPGIYFYSVKAGSQTVTKKMIVE